jgi:hypothetical protein
MQDEELLTVVGCTIRIFTAQETYFETLGSLAQFLKKKRQFCLSNIIPSLLQNFLTVR